MQISKLAPGFTGPTPHRTASQPQLDTVDLGGDVAADILFGTAQKRLAAEALSAPARKKLGHVPTTRERLWNLASGKTVALGVDFRTVTATDLNTGEVLWTHKESPQSLGGLRPLRPDCEGKYLALTDGHSRVALLNGENGEVSAEIAPPIGGYITISEFTKKGHLVVGVKPTPRGGSRPVTHLMGYDPKKPEEPLWRVKLAEGGLGETAESPNGELLYVTAANAYTVHAIDTGSGELVWSKKSNFVTDPAVAKDGTVIVRGVGYDPETRAPRWKVKGEHISVPLKDDNENLYFSVDGNLHARTPEGRKKWERNDPGRRFMHPPVVANNVIYSVSESRRDPHSWDPQRARLHIIDRETGQDLAVSETLNHEVSRGFFRAGHRVILSVPGGYVSVGMDEVSYEQLADRVAREKEALSIDIGDEYVTVGDFELEVMNE